MKKNITSAEFEETSQKEVSKVNENEKTKKKSNAQKAIPWLIITVVSLVIVLTCVLIAYYQVYSSGKQNANILEGVYASSYYSMVDNVNNLSVDLSKYSTLSSTKAKMNNIQDMMVDCNYIVAGLSILPIDEENVVSSTKFFNQVNGLCQAYLNQLNEGKELTMEQELMFDKIGLVVGRIKANFNEQNASMYDANFNFVDASIFDNTGMNELSAGLGDLTDGAIDYPAMIFDGPFSTALETNKVLGLGEKEYSVKETEDYLKQTVFANRKDVKISHVRSTDGDIATYDFLVKIDGKDFDVQVSRLGCLLMTISSYAESGDPVMSREQAVEMAKTFANNVGFEDMESVWAEVNNGVVYVNLVSVDKDVLLYPDMVKVKVDLVGQEIVGFEAVNYAFNHRDREMEFVASEQDAEKLLGFDYRILKTSKAIIRLDSGKEVSVYEFITERIDGTFFYYVDANNLEIVKTLKLVNVQDVEKLI